MQIHAHMNILKSQYHCTLAFVAGAVILLTAVAAYASCMHQGESATSLDICSTCAASGRVPQNGGQTCGFQSATSLVFCNCSPNKDCKSSAGGQTMWVDNYSNGTCGGGICYGATKDSHTWSSMTLKYSQMCY